MTGHDVRDEGLPRCVSYRCGNTKHSYVITVQRFGVLAWQRVKHRLTKRTTSGPVSSTEYSPKRARDTLNA